MPKCELFTIYYKNSELVLETSFETSDKKHINRAYHCPIYLDIECTINIGTLNGTGIKIPTNNAGLATSTVFIKKNKLRNYKNGGGITWHFYISPDKKAYPDRKVFTTRSSVLSGSLDFFDFNSANYFHKGVVTADKNTVANTIYKKICK